MLNISQVSVSSLIDRKRFKSYNRLNERKHSRIFIRVLISFFVMFLLFMFLPWTQNIRSEGRVSTLNPYDKPQNIQSLIGGQITEWKVKEGDIVKAGDTIVILSESKAEYLDPDLLLNTKVQQETKLNAVENYKTKIKLLKDQLTQLQKLQESKLNQLKIKKEQNLLEIETTNQEFIATRINAENASNQYNRMREMHDKGIKSLTDLESKKLSFNEANAKLLSAENKLNKIRNENLSLDQEIEMEISEYNQKVAKLESDIQSAESYIFSLLGDSNKLQSKYNQIQKRQNAFVITSPISGRITKVLKNGIGEFVKSQDNIATIIPLNFQKAVELFIEPRDMPLIQEGKEVRIQFDGWPAIIFSGWPENSFGTFGGVVYAIDNDISENGKYRILVVESDTDRSWPELVRIGSGARGLLLLNEVKVYYELWRRLNGFPPDFYNPEQTKSIKNKAPLKKVK